MLGLEIRQRGAGRFSCVGYGIAVGSVSKRMIEGICEALILRKWKV